MHRIKVKDIKVIYEEDNNEIKEFIGILKNNYYLFEDYLEGKEISFIPINREDIVYIDNPLVYADEVIKEYTYNERAFHKFDNIPLEKLYIGFLARKLDVDKNKSFVNIDYNVSNERYDMSFYYIVSYHYFKEKGRLNDYVNFIKYRKEKQEILKWLQNKVRYNVCNMLLEKVTKYFDDYFCNNIETITKAIELEFDKDDIIEDKKELQQMDHLECEYLFKKFLMFIKAPKEWFLKFEELKKNKRIIYKNMGEKIDRSRCFLEDGVLKILIDDEGTVISFIDLVHEFMHYVSWKSTGTIGEYAIIELPSIFFEKLSSMFLVENGYDKKILEAVYKERENNNYMTSISIMYVFEVINDFIKNGCIEKEKEIIKIQKYIDLIKEDRVSLNKIIHMYNKMGREFKAECIVDNKYDKLTKDIIEKGPFMILGYQYILGTIISDEILKKHDIDMIEKMILVTSNLSDYQLEDIINLFDISLKPIESIKKKEYN